MSFTHLLVTRPRQESNELAAMIEPLGIRAIIQPGFDFEAIDASAEQSELLSALESDPGSPLIVFTSTRAVEFGLPQLPAGFFSAARIAAIGPATSQALEAAGIRVDVSPESGFTSESLLQTLQQNHPAGDKTAVIIAAPGGRRKMEESLTGFGWSVQKLLVYRRLNAPIEKSQLSEILDAGSVLSVWTSANTMQSLAQRLPTAAWFKLCQGEFLVISERLMRVARAYGPKQIHQSNGPGNHALFSAIRTLI